MNFFRQKQPSFRFIWLIFSVWWEVSGVQKCLWNLFITRLNYFKILIHFCCQAAIFTSTGCPFPAFITIQLRMQSTGQNSPAKCAGSNPFLLSSSFRLPESTEWSFSPREKEPLLQQGDHFERVLLVLKWNEQIVEQTDLHSELLDGFGAVVDIVVIVVICGVQPCWRRTKQLASRWIIAHTQLNKHTQTQSLTYAPTHTHTHPLTLTRTRTIWEQCGSLSLLSAPQKPQLVPCLPFYHQDSGGMFQLWGRKGKVRERCKGEFLLTGEERERERERVGEKEGGWLRETSEILRDSVAKEDQ